MSQNVAARNPESLRLTSRERITRLEGGLASLWRYVKDQQPRTAPGTVEATADEGTEDEHGRDSEISSESEGSDPSPGNRPSHLQALFENSLFDSIDAREQAPRRYKSSEARLSRARNALQSLMPSEEDVPTLAARAVEWVAWANSIVPLVFIASTKDELILDWDRARKSDAQPTTVAAVLLITAMTIHVEPQSPLHGRLTDASAYSKSVSDAIETYIVNDDFFAGTLEGLEVCLLSQRLHFAHAGFQELWLSLRRTIALAELLGLPRASVAPSVDQPRQPSWTRRGQTREQVGALLWQATCTMERLMGCMFGLPVTTRMYPPPTNRPVFVNSQLVPQAYFCRLADIAGKIPALDDMCAKGQPPLQACGIVLEIDREFRELASLAPRSWWDPHPNQQRLTPDLVFQYFHQYFTARAHLQLALHNDGSNIYAYSYMVCTDACRDMAVRYTVLRPLVLGGFFPVRLFDVQAVTAAIFLLHTCHGPGSSREIEASRTPPSQVLIQHIVDCMDSMSEGVTGQFAQEAARTIRSLSALLSNNFATDSRHVSVRVPLLGRIHVSRQTKPKSAEPLAGGFAIPPRMYGTHDANAVPFQQSERAADAMPPNTLANDDSWSMEISEVLPFLTNDAYAPDQWRLFGDLNVDGFSFEQM